MAGLREFVVQFDTEEKCIEHLAGRGGRAGDPLAEPHPAAHSQSNQATAHWAAQSNLE